MVAGQAAGLRSPARTGKAVVRVRPGGGLFRVEPGCADSLGQLRELIAAALADGGKRHRVPSQPEGDLIRLASGVPAGHGLHGQHRTIDAT
jgi:hypothetical protein